MNVFNKIYTLYQKSTLSTVKYYYIEIPVERVCGTDIYVKTGQREDYEMEKNMREITDSQVYATLCIENEPELYWFFKQQCGNMYSALLKKLEELESRKAGRYIDGYVIYVKSGNSYKMNVSNGRVTFSQLL